MREIKFRAWDEEFKEVLYFTLNEILQPEVKPSFMRNNVIEQFTGLHDKNGKEIYEGDIILNPLYEEPYVVEYAENLAGYVGWGDDRICGCYLITDEDIEVIGNIHENPELRKQEERDENNIQSI